MTATARFTEFAGEGIAREWQQGLYAQLARAAVGPRQFALAPERAQFTQEVRQIIYRRTAGAVAYRLLFWARMTRPTPRW